MHKGGVKSNAYNCVQGGRGGGGLVKKTKATFIAITESKLDHTIPDLEVNLPGFDILHCDKNRNGGGFACYIRKDLRFNKMALNCKESKNIIFEIHLSK